MKIFFSVELSEDIPKEYIFQIASTDDTLAEEYEQASRAIDIIKSKAKLPAGLHILRFVLYYFLILVFMCIFMVLGNFVSALKALIFLPIYSGGIITGLYFIRRCEKTAKKEQKTATNSDKHIKSSQKSQRKSIFLTVPPKTVQKPIFSLFVTKQKQTETATKSKSSQTDTTYLWGCSPRLIRSVLSHLTLSLQYR